LFAEKASAFDLDYTLVQVNSSFAFCKYLVTVKVLPISAFFYAVLIFIRHRFFGLSLQEMHEKVFHRVLRGKDLRNLETHAEIFCKTHLLKKIYAPAVALLIDAKQAGHYTLLISSSPSFLVRHVADFFHIDEWMATEYEVDSHNCLQRIHSLVDGNAKAEWIASLKARQGIDRENIIAYSDSYLDMPFLLAAGEAVAVNPDKKLKNYFKQKNWRVI
jgi:HAD superfamily hydrolase (TIGR01490 family)